MHARFGQTVGKMVARVKILDASESRGPSFWQCLVRDLPEYLVATLTAIIPLNWCNWASINQTNPTGAPLPR